MTVRAVAKNADIYVYIDDLLYAQRTDTLYPITTGKPGIGVLGTWGSNYVGPVSFGHLDTTARNAVAAPSIASSAGGFEVDLAWQPPSDDPMALVSPEVMCGASA